MWAHTKTKGRSFDLGLISLRQHLSFAGKAGHQDLVSVYLSSLKLELQTCMVFYGDDGNEAQILLCIEQPFSFAATLLQPQVYIPMLMELFKMVNFLPIVESIFTSNLTSIQFIIPLSSFKFTLQFLALLSPALTFVLLTCLYSSSLLDEQVQFHLLLTHSLLTFSFLCFISLLSNTDVMYWSYYYIIIFMLLNNSIMLNHFVSHLFSVCMSFIASHKSVAQRTV